MRRRTGARNPTRPARATPNPVKRIVGRDEHVARMEAAMMRADRAGEVDGAAELRRQAQHLVEGRRAPLPQCDVERLGGHVRLGEVRDAAFETGGDRRRDHRMREFERDEPLQFRGEFLRALGRHVDAEDFDRHEPVATRVVRAKHGTLNPRANLVEDRKGPNASGGE
jgi:hypothetical protein